MKKNIVIISYGWTPQNAIGVNRVYSWAKNWSKYANVTILTSVKKSFDNPLDLIFPELPNVKIIKIPYGRGSLAPTWLLNSNFIRQITRSIKQYLSDWIGFSFDPRLAWYEPAKQVAEKISKENDIVVSSYGPEANHLLGAAMKLANPSIFWIADYRDLWSQNQRNGNSKGGRDKTEKKEFSSVGDYADIVTTVSEDMKSKLSVLLNKPIYVMPNGFDLNENLVRERILKSVKNKSAENRTKPFRIVYTGTIYRGYQNPEPLLKALSDLMCTRALKSESVTVDFFGERVDLAKRLKKKKKYSDLIRIMGHVDRNKALEAQKNADVLLLLEDSSEVSRGVLTGKIFEYMVAGRPILCIGSRKDFEIGQMLEKTGTGVLISQNEFHVLPSLLQETIEGKGVFSFYNPKLDEILAYSRERQAEKFFSLIESCSP
jgi:hypothetical protein